MGYIYLNNFPVVNLQELADYLGSSNTWNSILSGEGNVLIGSKFDHPVSVSGKKNIFYQGKASGLVVSGNDNMVIDSEFVSNDLHNLSAEETREAFATTAAFLEDRSDAPKLRALLKKLLPNYIKAGVQLPTGEIISIELGK